MGKSTYYIVVAAVIVLGLIMPQNGPRKKHYITLMAMLHTFVCGWRYKLLTGDLIKYAAGFSQIMEEDWMSEELLHGGRNFGFFWLEKLIHNFISSDFQWVLIVIAIITELTLAILIYRYSPRPWLSYLMWNCVGFYVFGFSAIKQALAMGLLLPACDGLLTDNKRKFLIWTLLAGAAHTPALIFLPAYWITHSDKQWNWIVFLVAALLIVVFRSKVAGFLSQFYYSNGELDELGFVNSSRLGGRFFMMIMLLAMGYFAKGLGNVVFRRVFKLLAAAVVIQSMSGLDNIFTRLADYYFQFVVLYTPMLFYENERNEASKAVFRLSKGNVRFAVAVTMCFSIWFYSYGCLQPVSYAVDDYTNYRFCWEVADESQLIDPGF